MNYYLKLLFPTIVLNGNSVNIPSKSGYGGPIGFMLDLILLIALDTVEVGKQYVFKSITPGGEKNKFGAKNTVIKLSWNASLSLEDLSTFKASLRVTYSSEQEGLMNVLLNTLLQRVTITVQGKGEVKAEISLRNFLVIKEWLFSIDVKIFRDLGLGDIICKLWSSAEEAIEKVPNLKEALNSVKIGVYVGGKF